MDICNQCQSTNTTRKWITSKKNGQKYELIECQNGCKNGRYNYSFFPPKNGDFKKVETKSWEQKEAEPSKDVLRSIDATLKQILNVLQKTEPETLDTEAPF